MVDTDGRLIAKKRISEGPDGFTELLGLLSEAGDTAEDPIPVAIETPRRLRATDRSVYAISPVVVARYRSR